MHGGSVMDGTQKESCCLTHTIQKQSPRSRPGTDPNIEFVACFLNNTCLQHVANDALFTWCGIKESVEGNLNYSLIF